MKLYNTESGKKEWKSAAEVYDKLISSINNVYEDVVLGSGHIDQSKHPEEHHLYNNPFNVVDGPCCKFFGCPEKYHNIHIIHTVCFLSMFSISQMRS